MSNAVMKTQHSLLIGQSEVEVTVLRQKRQKGKNKGKGFNKQIIAYGFLALG